MLTPFLPSRTLRWLVYPFAGILAIMPLPYGAKVFYPLAVAVILPMMFRITESNRADRVIGELSYPFYIFHMFALALAEAIQVHWQFPAGAGIWLGLVLAFLLSVLGLLLELRLLEPWRARFSTRQLQPER